MRTKPKSTEHISRTKTWVYNIIVLPSVLYASETWTLLKKHDEKFSALEMAQNCIRSSEIEDRTGTDNKNWEVYNLQVVWTHIKDEPGQIA